MDTIKSGKQLIELVELCFMADTPLLLWGRHGVGKSEVLAQAAKENSLNYICLDLSLLEPVDLTGLPIQGSTTTKYLPPDFLPTSGQGLLVFEELNRCDRLTRVPCLQLLTARCLNDYRLPDGWLPMATLNPSDENYEVFELDNAFTSRFVQATIVPDQAEWLEWAAHNNVHPSVLNYVSSDQTSFASPVSNPRAWKYVSDVMKNFGNSKLSRKTLRSAIVGLVGNERGIAFLRSLKQIDKPLAADKILGSYGQYRAAITAWIKEGRTDLLENTLLAVKKYLQPKADFEQVQADAKRCGNLGAFLDDLPGDLREQMEQWLNERTYDIPQLSKRKGKKS